VKECTDHFVELERARHDRASFDCGEPELNCFLQTRALNHMRAGVSKTVVLPATFAMQSGKLPICAFYTIAPGSITRSTLPDAIGKTLPRYPVPVFLLAQLAVDRAYQGKGLGRFTLIRALEQLWKVHQQMPAYAVVVDCITPSLSAFYAKYGFNILSTAQGNTRMFLPIQQLAEL